jgi:hypothetical protein
LRLTTFRPALSVHPSISRQRWMRTEHNLSVCYRYRQFLPTGSISSYSSC